MVGFEFGLLVGVGVEFGKGSSRVGGLKWWWW